VARTNTSTRSIKADCSREHPVGKSDTDDRRLGHDPDRGQRHDVPEQRARRRAGTGELRYARRATRHAVEQRADLGGGLRPCGRLLLETSHDQRGERGRHIRAHFLDRARSLREVRRQRPLRRASGERRLTGEELVRHTAERVDVGAMIDVRIAGGLLGRDVRRCSDRRAELREGAVGYRRVGRLGCRERLRDAEVRYDGRTTGEQNVVRLDVTVHDAALMRVGKRARDVAEDADDFGNRERSRTGQPRSERLTFDERHRVIRHAVELARGEHGNDLRLE
jgi:hypothetical protein